VTINNSGITVPLQSGGWIMIIYVVPNIVIVVVQSLLPRQKKVSSEHNSTFSF
jgi:hypothetical protein